MKLNYKLISTECISLASFILTIYIFCIGNLLNTEQYKKMKQNVDKILKDKTELGVLKKYIEKSFLMLMLLIVISLYIKLNIDFPFAITTHYYVFSAVCFSILNINFLYLYFIIKFILNKLI